MANKGIDQIIEGKLVKLGYSFPEKWQKRFFRIVGNEIQYWKKQKDSDKKGHIIPIAPDSEASKVHTGVERRSFDAVGWSVRKNGVFYEPVMKKEHCFKIRSPEKPGARMTRTWYLVAESDQQRDMWVDALKAKISTLANSEEGRTEIANRLKRDMQELGIDDDQIKQIYNAKLLDQTSPQENMLSVANLVMATAACLPIGQAGLLVVKVFDNSPAHVAGLQVQTDLILAVAGQPVSVDFKEAERNYTQTTQQVLDAQGTLDLTIWNKASGQSRTVTLRPFKGAHPGTNGFMYAHVVGQLPVQAQQSYPGQQNQFQGQVVQQPNPYQVQGGQHMQAMYQQAPPVNGFGAPHDEHHDGEVVTDMAQVQQHLALQRKTTLHQLVNQMKHHQY